MNKKELYGIIAFLFLVIVCLLTYKSSEKIVFSHQKESLVHDLGVLHKNAVYSHTFQYINTSYDSLKVYGVKDGCDCTESKVKKGVYMKDDTVLINTEYHPGRYNDDGLINKQIFLITNKNISKFDTLLPLILKANIK